MKTRKSFVLSVDLSVPEPGNNTADAERLKEAVKKKSGIDSLFIPLSVLKELPLKIRRWNHRVKLVMFKDSGTWFTVAIENPEKKEPICGIAADIGTTRIVLRLLNLETGDNLGEKSFDNPQAVIAPDVLARIHHATDDAGRKELQSLIVEEMNRNIAFLSRSCRLDPSCVYLFCGAGNTAMTHLFLGLDPSYIIREPYIPCVNTPEPVSALEIGLKMNPSAQVFLFPNIGSYFGGDLISGILYAEIHKKENPCIMVDVGTNAEVVVGNRDWLIACAGAAGPALEGGMSDMGMTAGPGVIDKVTIDRNTGDIDLRTIDNIPAIGLCGSGMIDLAAGLFLSGMIDIRGKFSKKKCRSRLFEKDGISCFRLIDKDVSGTGKDIILSQTDIDSLTSSKAAMYSILEVMVNNTAGLSFNDLSKFYVAGTFGSFINPESAISIGMLPDIPMEKFEVLGNSSLKGAAKLLLDPDCFEEINEIRKSITYIELNVNQEFMNIFSGAKFYPHTDKAKFPSVTAMM